MKTSHSSSVAMLALVSSFALGCSAGGDDSAESSGGASSGGKGTGGGSSGGTSSAGSASTGGTSSGSGGSGGTATGGNGGASTGSGGTTNGGDAGSGGTGGTDPHVVLDCDNLGEVGVWEKISPNDYTAHGFVADPINAGTVYVGCGEADNFFTAAGAFKTTDCGATWNEVASGSGSQWVNSGRQWSWLADPVHSGTIYTVSGYGTNGFYKTTNGGDDWIDVTPTGDGAPGFVGGPEQMDPEDPEHLLLTWHGPCGTYEDHIGCFAESTDGGASWVEHYRDPDWQEEVRIYLLHGDTWIAPSDGLQRTTDGGESWTPTSDLTGGGHSSGVLYHSSAGAYYIGTGGGVIRSTDDGVSWTKPSNAGAYVMGVIGTGTTMYAGAQGGILTAPENDGTTWTLMDSPFDDLAEGCWLDYDDDHKLLYASCHGGSYPNGTNGIWRVKLE